MKSTQLEYTKPKTFRNRKKHGSKEMQREEQSKRVNEAPHPRHQPYERPRKDWTDIEDDIHGDD